jgi:hypothetical protein
MDEVNPSTESLYNKESTIAQPISQLMKLEVFIRLTNMMSSLQILLKTNKTSGTYLRALQECEASITILYLYLKPSIKNSKQKELIETIDEAFKKDKKTTEELKAIVEDINDYMTNTLRLTAIATKQDYKATDIIGRNKIKLGY